MKRFIVFSILMVGILSLLPAQTSEGNLDEKLNGLREYPGFFKFYINEETGQVYLLVENLDEEFLMVASLSRGMGSNDVGLDRGKLGARRVLSFEKSGGKLLMVEPNYEFRAVSSDPYERKAVEESFARSVIWGFKIEARQGEKYLVEITPFLLSDQNNVANLMSRTAQGTYKPDVSRSGLNLERTRNFPDNSEFDVNLTFSGQPKGRYVRSVVPSPAHMTLGQHISFIRLPALGEYQPREFVPGSGFGYTEFMDLATPLGEPLMKKYIERHRLEKRNPGAPVSEAVEPIIYYLDPGTPEPVRSALLEGAGWWSEAFEASGYKNAYQVKMLPEDADPLDVRYNVIQWVHRSTRGWSYGSSVTDPRTGEILKGHVSLGSQRVRQDYMIAEAILAPYEGAGEQLASGEEQNEMEKMALARLRQLSAHEVGHTLGFMHNYIASADGRASVMDYPHPLIKLKDGEIDLSAAYDEGVGAWDKVFVAYGYQDFQDGADEGAELEKILETARKEGLRFLSDQDARPEGSAHPATHLWDNGEDACMELKRMMEIRKKVLENFSEKTIKHGMPYSELEDLLVPAFMMHRYQLEAAVKSIGGVRYNYALRGEDLQLEMVPADKQKECLETVIETLAPEFLAVPKGLLSKIPPKPLGYSRDRENFKSRTGLTFDPLSAAEVASDQTISLLLHPQRASRLITNFAVDPQQPELKVVLDKLVFSTWQTIYDDPYLGEIQRVSDNLVLHHLMQLATDQAASVQARAIASLKIDELEIWLRNQVEYIRDEQLEAHYSYALRQISHFRENPDDYIHETPLDAPPGQPIGNCLLNYF